MSATRKVVIGLLLIGCAANDAVDQLDQAASVNPQRIEGNPTCGEQLGLFAVRIDPPNAGTYDIGAGTVTVTTDGVHMSWTSTEGIDAVLVKGGPAANLYLYDPPAESFGDTDLVSPDNAGGSPAAISHIDFCFDYELSVTKTARTSLTRTYTWGVTKSAAAEALTLSPGQTYLMPYEVTASVTGSADSDHAASGTVVISNPAPISATIVSISDHFNDVEVTLDCGVTLPYVLTAGGVIECSYQLALDGPESGVNEVTVATTGAVGGDSAAAAVDFGSATVSEIDECVSIDDDRYGPLGSVCAAAAPQTIRYTMAIGPFSNPDDCGEQTVDNTATAIANDTGATASASATVTVEVPCELGCTLTQGYWKTHSAYGPAPEDDNWLLLLPSGPDSTFFSSGATYYQVAWTNPAGNAYYVLAHQYIAAELNHLNGASFADAQTAFDQATAVFAAYTPAQIGALKGANSLRLHVVALAVALDAYNRGVTGPGHCSE